MMCRSKTYVFARAGRTPGFTFALLFLFVTSYVSAVSLVTESRRIGWKLGEGVLPSREGVSGDDFPKLSFHPRLHRGELLNSGNFYINPEVHKGDVFQRNQVRFVLRYAVQRVSAYEPGDAPRRVLVTQNDRIFVNAHFEEGSHTFEGEAAEEEPVRVRMLNAEREPVSSDPFYYELTESGGDRFLMYAQGGENQPFGAVAIWHPADGAPKTLEDLGLTLQTDETGAITHARSSSHLILLRDEGGESYRVTHYEGLEAPSAETAEGRFMEPEGIRPRAEYFLEHYSGYTNPALQVTTHYPSGRIQRIRMATNRMGLYHAFFFDENWEVMEGVLEQGYNEDRTRFYRVTQRWAYGGFRTTTHVDASVDGAWKEVERRVEYRNEVSVQTYTYYTEPSFRQGKVKIIRHDDGRWEAFDYDEKGRRDLEIQPIRVHRQEVKYVEDSEPAEVEDEDLEGLFSAFTDGAPEGKRREAQTVTEYRPKAPPENVRASLEEGEVRVHQFTHPDSSVERSSEETRPAVTTVYREGEFVERIWFTYDVEEDGRKVTRTETSRDPDAGYGHPRNFTGTRRR